MNIRKWIAPSIALAAIAAVHCGGDNSATIPTTSSGAAGSAAAGSGGAGGSGKGGGSTSSGAAGSSGSTSDDAGSSDGTGAGGSGSTDSGGGGGKADGATGSAGSASGGSAGSTGGGAGSTPDAGRADSRNDAVAPTDAGASDASACPAGAPMDGETCTGGEICTYGDVGCACVRAMGMRREWQCRRVPDAAQDPDCPSSPPAAATSCADAGAGTVCRYANNVFCACDQLDQWRCTL